MAKQSHILSSYYSLGSLPCTSYTLTRANFHQLPLTDKKIQGREVESPVQSHSHVDENEGQM